MASFRTLRTGGRSAKAGRSIVSRYARPSLAAAALLALSASVFVASQLATIVWIARSGPQFVRRTQAVRVEQQRAAVSTVAHR
jgi:hypothetical protein